ncbi:MULTISPECIES: ead/Ea22-like family protein [Escherichia]|uniref:ead/Ea22-like family protein n=1 Tax=Escherichia TaxID=561 RepID=UPI000B1719F0
MSNIGYQELREAAEAIKVVATPQKLLAFRMKVTPQVVLALLDERERNQQYIKRRDQENEDIALTVGKLRVELEAAKKRIAELESNEVLARIALASLEAEPIGAFHIAEQQVDGTSDYIKDGEWPIDNGIIEVYAAPPVPVVPAALPENDDEDGHDIDYLEPSEVYALGRTAGWNACRAAMLQGKSEQPQNAQQNIPENIPGGNSPVTPDGYADMLQRWLVFGIGMLKAGSQLPRNLIAETKAMVAALQQEDE